MNEDTGTGLGAPLRGCGHALTPPRSDLYADTHSRPSAAVL